MKKSVHTYRIFVTTALILFCIAIHQKLDAGFHIAFSNKEVRECKAAERPLFSDDHLTINVLLRFISDQR